MNIVERTIGQAQPRRGGGWGGVVHVGDQAAVAPISSLTCGNSPITCHVQVEERSGIITDNLRSAKEEKSLFAQGGVVLSIERLAYNQHVEIRPLPPFRIVPNYVWNVCAPSSVLTRPRGTASSKETRAVTCCGGDRFRAVCDGEVHVGEN